MTFNNFPHSWLKNRSNTTAHRKPRLHVEHLEDRANPATFYVDNPGDFVITTDQGADGLDAGDIVSWNPTDGSQTPVTGLVFGTDAFGTIQSAIDAAAATGDTIRIAAGTFSELVTVNKSVTLLGNQAGVDARTRTSTAETIANGTDNGSGLRSTSFNITASDVVLDGFTVQGASNANTFGFGIRLAPSTAGSEIRNNIIQDNISGLSLANNSASNQTIIEKNLFRNNNVSGPGSGHGIYTDQFTAGGTVQSVAIRDNSFVGHSGQGIGFSSTDSTKPATNITIANNLFDANGRALYAFNLTNSTISGNTIQNSTDAATADIRLFEGVSALTVTRNVLQNGVGWALRLNNTGTGAANATGVTFTFNSITGYTRSGELFQVDAASYTGTLNAASNWWGDVTGPTSAANPGGSGVVISDPSNVVKTPTWLVYAPDGDASINGVQFVSSFTVEAQTDNFTTANNNYRRLVNVFDNLQNGQTVILSGNFDWTESNAAASWALGNNGVDDWTALNDDYSIFIRRDLSNITITADSLGSARIQGPSDLASVNQEAFLVIISAPQAYPNWTISNLEIFDFDASIVMTIAAANAFQNRFDGLNILNNHIRVPADLTDDAGQNIGINYHVGVNQTIQGNIIDIVGSGVSDPANNKNSTSVGIQSTTNNNGGAFDGLLIDGNTIRVLDAQSAAPAVIRGIWENGGSNGSDITISNNTFVNLSDDNDPTLNRQNAFRIHSHSGTSATVTYSNNTVEGANTGFEWLATGNLYPSALPIVFTGNTLTDVQTGFFVQTWGQATLIDTTFVGTGTGTGVVVNTGSSVSVLGGSFTNTGVGIDVDGTPFQHPRSSSTRSSVALVENTDLNANSIAGLRVTNNATVDAGGGDYTGLGTSAGGNDFSSYGPATSGKAIQNLNTGTGTVGFTSAPPDIRAQNNIFAESTPDFLEAVIDHGADDLAYGYVDFSAALAINNPPVADAQTVTTNEDDSLSITLTGSSGDATQQTLTFTIVTGPSFGTLVNFNPATGEVTYVPGPNFNGTDSFTFTVTDDATAGDPANLTSAPATVTITVTAVADAPTLTVDDATGSERLPIPLNITVALADTTGSEELGPITISGVPAGATLSAGTNLGNGVWRLTAAQLAGLTITLATEGTYTLTVTAASVEPSSGDTASTTQTLTVTAGNIDMFAVAGSNATVNVFDASTGELMYTLTPYGANFRGEIRTTTGDITGDGTPDIITGAGAGGASHVRVYNGKTGEQIDGPLGSFFAFGDTFFGGVFVAAGDIDGDGFDELIVSAGPGAGPHVKVFSGQDGSLLQSFFAYDPTFTGGVTVTTGDITGDGTPDIITGVGAGGASHVKVFDGQSGKPISGPLGSFFAFGDTFFGGVFVAAGDTNGDGFADLIVGAGPGAGPHVKVFSGQDGSLLQSFFAYDSTFTGGVRVKAEDVDGDGLADIVTGAGPGGAPHVKAFDGLTLDLLASFFATDVDSTGGVYVG